MSNSTEMMVVVLVTTPSSFDSAAFARTLVEDGVAACVNIAPTVQSVYRWEGKVCVDAEALCIIKTAQRNVPALQARVHALHPADVPEFVVLDVDTASPAYLDWVLTSSAV